ncbi:MAG: energy transducer TonB [Gammaproteobacteria bacterium]
MVIYTLPLVALVLLSTAYAADVAIKPGMAAGQTPAGSGNNEPEVPASGPGTRTGSLSPAEARYAIERYQQQIHATEIAHGAYDNQISEELLGLGLARRDLGQDAEAVKAFDRALYITRINQGLSNPNQLPILELIIESNTALSDWKALDQNYHYLYWVYRRAYGDDDPRLLPVIDRVGLWHLNAYQMGVDDRPFQHLASADNLYSHAIEIIEQNYGPTDPRLIDPLYGGVLTNYQIAVYASSADKFEGIRFTTASSSRAQRLQEEQQARQEAIHDSYIKGKKAMNRILDVFEHNPQLPPDSHALARVHLGDWYLLFNKRNSAMRNYGKAFTLLDGSGIDRDKINRLFSRPRSLPAYNLPLPYKSKSDKDKSYVLASLVVTKSGQPRNIHIIEAKPANSTSLRRRAKKTIRATRFRPRFENGQPVATEDFNIRYIFEE